MRCFICRAMLGMLLAILVGTISAAQEGEAVDIAPNPAPVTPPAAPSTTGTGEEAPAAAPLPAPMPASTVPSGSANIAESGQDVAGNEGMPTEPPPPGSGIASGGAAAIGQPVAGGAGNAADAGRAGPGMRGQAPNAADSPTKPEATAKDGVPSDLKTDTSLFSVEDFADLLPGFAQDQPGAVQGQPGAMLTQPEKVEGFSSLLPESQLPPGTVQESVQRAQGDPAYQLNTNFGRLVVPTGMISGSTKSKQFHIEGGLTVYYEQVKIQADSADIDEKEEIAVLKGGVSIDDPKYSMTTEELRIRFEDKLFQATGFVQFKKLADGSKRQPNLSLPKKDRLREYFAGQQFELYCMNLHYNWDTKQLIALDSVRMVHPSFAGTMDRVDYDDKSKQYAINGNVKLDVTNYEWIFENQLTEKADEARTRAVTDKPTHIECDRLLYSEESGLAQFFSQPGKQVVFDQTDRKITGAYLEVNDKTKDFHVEGTTTTPLTYDQTSGEWLFAGGLINRDEASQELKDALANPLSATAQRLTYNFDRKRLELTGAVKMTTEGKALQADAITQDQTAKFFLMQGNVMIQPDADSKVYAAQVYLDTANDVVSFVGLVQGQFKNDDLAVQGGAGGANPDGTPLETPSGLFENTGGTLPTGPGARGVSGLQPDDDEANVAEGR